MDDRLKEWKDYYTEFPYFNHDLIRAGNHPRFAEHENAEDAIVLVHGLSDSPHYMAAIGNYFFDRLDYNVYLPLLHFHGLNDPDGMEGVELEEWKRNVRWSVQHAAARAGRVSIGGLSTGGALSFYTACTSPRVNGDVFLFSAALQLAVRGSGLLGDIAEALLTSDTLPWIIDVKNIFRSLIGDNPFKYDHVDADGARELARLIKEIEGLMSGFDRDHPFPGRIFAAHSEADETAHIDGILALRGITRPGTLGEYLIDAKKEVAHADLVLNEPIPNGDEPLAKANPLFDDMMEKAAEFARSR